MQDGPSSWRYVGGEVYNESFPLRCGYAEVSKRLNDKFGDTVSFKYLSPGEEMDPDNLVQVQGDDDLQVRQGRRADQCCFHSTSRSLASRDCMAT